VYSILLGISRKDTSPKLRSAFADDSLIGRIYVEASSLEFLIDYCSRWPHMHPKRALPIPFEVMTSYLGTWHIPFVPKVNSWIRLRGGRYRNDVGFITSVDGQGSNAQIDVLLVPRVKYSTKAKGRPEMGLFDPNRAQTFLKRGQRLKVNSGYCFRKTFYRSDCYLKLGPLEENEYYPENLTPTIAELEGFRACSSIPRALFESAIHLARGLLMKGGERVKVISGDMQGAVGKVVSLLGEEASLLLEDDSTTTVLVRHLRKKFCIGDEVLIQSGVFAGKSGWIIKFLTEDLDGVRIYNHNDNQVLKHPSNPLLLLKLFYRNTMH
jgi:ribosomal protein L24